MKLKYMTLTALLLVLAVIGTACRGSNNQIVNGSGPASATAEPATTLKIYNFKVEMAEQLDTLVKRYQEETGVNIEVDTCGGGCDYSAGLKTKFNSNDKPDIFFVAGYTDLELWQEYLEDLSDQPWVGDMLDLAKPAITKDGKIYGMPLALEGWGFIYNKDLFRQAGINFTPATLTQLREAADKLRAAGIRPFENGYAEWWILGNHLLNTAFAQQPDPVAFIERLKNGRAALTDNTIFKEWTSLIDLTVEYGQPNPLQTDYYTQVANFANGRAAMMQQGTWTQLQIDKLHPNLNIGFLPMPINDDAKAMNKLPVGVANYWVVLKNSRTEEEAKAFLRWLVSSRTGQAFIVDDAKLIPAFRSIPATEAQLGPLSGEILSYIKEGKILPWLWQLYPGYEATTSLMATQIQSYIGKKIGKEKMLQEFQNIWDDMSAKEASE
ncbi:ABC transporter substrate-binding protein [Paenibacillus sp. P3E]|uniref:ABC transporter substrate-binding protein n=1 Tax=Paenibacillus sp. P3E TaxID=1349435 RepID=UPI000AA0340D|nr:ABC transporter substrate-binding protein [Paenibacillus sp. P3E]